MRAAPNMSLYVGDVVEFGSPTSDPDHPGKILRFSEWMKRPVPSKHDVPLLRHTISIMKMALTAKRAVPV